MKKSLCIITFIVSVVISFGFTSMAFADKEENDVVEAGEIIVTANRYEETTSSVPASVTIITEKDIDTTAARDIPDMLRTVAGIHVNDITGNRRSYTVDLRGFGETAGLNTLVLVDGRKTNQADLSGTDWSQIPLDRVSRIEIIKGGRASVLYGDNAAGGIINIITKKGDDFKTGLKAAYGSYKSYKASTYLSGSNNNLSYALTGSYYDSDGYRDNSETEAKDFGLDLGYRLGEIGAINLSFGIHKDSTSLPGAFLSSELHGTANRNDGKNLYDYADTQDWYIKLSPEIYFLSDSMFKVDISYRRRDTRNYATGVGFAGPWFFDAKNDIKTFSINPQFIIHEKIFGKQNTFTVGYDLSKVKEDIENFSSYAGRANIDMEKRNYGFYAHNELMILEYLGLSAGYRYDRGEFEFDTSDPGTLRKTFDEELFTIGSNLNLGPRSNIYASYSRSFRYPVLDETFSYFTNTLVSGLSPQKSDDYEIGIRHYITDTLGISVSLFYIDTEDEIYYNPDLYNNMNMDGDTERTGVEITLKNSFKWGTASIAYTYTRAEIDGGMYDENDFPNVPEHQASATAVIDLWKPFILSVNSNYIGRRTFISDFNNNFTDQEDYVVVNAKLQYKCKNVTAFLDINNLFDREYDEYGVLGGFPLERAYYPSPGTNFMTGVSVDF